MRPALHLKVVRDSPEAGAPDARDAGDAGDVSLVAVLFALNLVPVVGELAHLGHWSRGIVGFAAGATVLTGRELWSQLRARARRNTDAER